MPQDECFPVRLTEIRKNLEAAGWFCEQSEARPTWPRAVIFADHPSGARFFLSMKWSANRRKQDGTRKWSSRRPCWFLPPARESLRSPWYRTVDAELRDGLIADPRLPLPSGISRSGFLPVHETGCQCEKIKFWGKPQAQDALRRAQEAQRGECRYYQCPDDARAFHLTSLAEVPRHLRKGK